MPDEVADDLTVCSFIHALHPRPLGVCTSIRCILLLYSSFVYDLPEYKGAKVYVYRVRSRIFVRLCASQAHVRVVAPDTHTHLHTHLHAYAHLFPHLSPSVSPLSPLSHSRSVCMSIGPIRIKSLILSVRSCLSQLSNRRGWPCGGGSKHRLRGVVFLLHRCHCQFYTPEAGAPISTWVPLGLPDPALTLLALGSACLSFLYQVCARRSAFSALSPSLTNLKQASLGLELNYIPTSSHFLI